MSGRVLAEDGALKFNPPLKKKTLTVYNIVTETFTNFELSLEWKISEGGNSGIFWGVIEDPDLNPLLYCPEVQVLHIDPKYDPARDKEDEFYQAERVDLQNHQTSS